MPKVGASGAARLLADVGDFTRFRPRGTSPRGTGPRRSTRPSGDHVRHRLSRAGNRQINRTLRIMTIVQLGNPTEGRAYYDRKKASGKTSMEAMRCLKRRLSDRVYRHMVDVAMRAMTGPGGHRGTPTDSSVTGSHPRTGPGRPRDRLCSTSAGSAQVPLAAAAASPSVRRFAVSAVASTAGLGLWPLSGRGRAAMPAACRQNPP